jgi:hypothetical protein
MPYLNKLDIKGDGGSLSIQIDNEKKRVDLASTVFGTRRTSISYTRFLKEFDRLVSEDRDNEWIDHDLLTRHDELTPMKSFEIALRNGYTTEAMAASLTWTAFPRDVGQEIVRYRPIKPPVEHLLREVAWHAYDLCRAKTKADREASKKFLIEALKLTGPEFNVDA